MLMTRELLLQGRGRKRGVNKGRDGLGWSSVDHGNPEVSFDCLVTRTLYNTYIIRGIYVYNMIYYCFVFPLKRLSENVPV